MRVLFATDGSRSADRARDLVARLPWPDGTVIRAVSAVEPRAELLGTPWVVPGPIELDEMEQELVRHARLTLEDAERCLTGPGTPRPGARVETILLRDRAASGIVEEATAWPADLVVVGSRGHGSISTMVLGSVSAEIVDHAPCPVLVVRESDIDEVILAADGSDGARLAERVLLDWPVLRHLPASVVSVADTRVPVSVGLPAGMYDEVGASWAHDVDSARELTRALAEEVAGRLRVAGVAAVAHPRDGDPAHEIVEFARARPRALVVLGTRGRRGLARLLLGSVARNVLTHAHNSILVVREGAAVRSEAI